MGRARKLDQPVDMVQIAETEKKILEKAIPLGFKSLELMPESLGDLAARQRVGLIRAYILTHLAPLALANIADILESPNTPNAKTRADLAIRVLDRSGIKATDAAGGKRPLAELSRAELQARIDDLRLEASNRAKAVVIESQATDILD